MNSNESFCWYIHTGVSETVQGFFLNFNVQDIYLKYVGRINSNKEEE